MRFYDHYTYRGKKIGAHAHPHGGRKKSSGSGAKSGLNKQVGAGKSNSAGRGVYGRPEQTVQSTSRYASEGRGVYGRPAQPIQSTSRFAEPKGGNGNRDRGASDLRKTTPRTVGGSSGKRKPNAGDLTASQGKEIASLSMAYSRGRVTRAEYEIGIRKIKAGVRKR